MTTTDIAQHVREMHDAWLVGDFDTAFASYAEDAIVHLGGRGLFSGTHHGKQRLMELSRQLHSAVDFSGRVIDFSPTMTMVSPFTKRR